MNGSIQEFLSFISKKWLYDVLVSLRVERKRFSELVEHINGISNKMLSDRLKELYEMDLIDKIVYSLMPVNIKYGLSNKGYELLKLYDQINNYTELIEFKMDR